MKYLLKKSTINNHLHIKLTGSKSETNRLLLLQALFSNITVDNISVSDDSEVMAAAIKISAEGVQKNEIDIHHAGTAMRFLTAYFAQKEGSEVVLTGSSRMQERPVSILVDALKQLGADIDYVNNFGFPPLSIWGKKLIKNKVSLPANVSSQYISALLLIAPKLENGLELTLIGEITSVPYIKMTLALLNQIGVETQFENNIITVKPHKTDEFLTKIEQKIIIESDWSSASYFYSIIALSPIGFEITLSSFKQNSLQADRIIAEIYTKFGVETIFQNQSILLKKTQTHDSETFKHEIDCANCPDIAQTIAVSAFGVGVGCRLIGLHTLKIKETDRLEALKKELTKLGATISVTNNSLTLQPQNQDFKFSADLVSIATYQDHRMAMAFAPLALKTDIQIEDAAVVSKSYPNFWEDLKNIGFEIVEN